MLETYYELDGKKFSLRADIIKDYGIEFVDISPNFISTISHEHSWMHMLQSVPSLKTSVTKYLLKLSKQNTIPIAVAYSGGIDSEIILYCAKEAGLNVTAFTVDVFGTNVYDLQYAKMFCSNHRINHEIIVLSEADVQEYLPKLCIDVETPAYLLLGGYVVADICYKNKLFDIVCVSNMDPCQLVIDKKFVYFSEAEYSMWTSKFNANRGIELIHDPMNDPDVFYSFINNRLITERLANCPYEMFFFDAKYLGKEYYYQDHEFNSLVRRFSQHGWEKLKKSYGYTKEMVPDCNPDLIREGKPYIKTYAAVEFINSEISKDEPDYDKFYWLQNNRTSHSQRFNYNNINAQIFIPTPPVGAGCKFNTKSIHHTYNGTMIDFYEL
jgi:hypothetical protein